MNPRRYPTRLEEEMERLAAASAAATADGNQARRGEGREAAVRAGGGVRGRLRRADHAVEQE